MDTVESTNLAIPGSESLGFWDQIRQLFARLFGGGSASPTAKVSARTTSTEKPSEDTGEFVIAPCGYAIRVPQPDDFSHSIGEMVPSVRQGLSLLPPLPGVAIELLREIQDPKSTAASVARIAASDPSLAASLIRMVNGAAMGLSRKITSANEAVSYLGFGVVKAMVVRLRLEEVLAPKSEGAAQDAEDLWAHSLAVSYVGERIARQVNGVDAGFVATLGLLHDIGKLAILSQLPEEAELLRAAAKAGDSSSTRTREAQILGVDHAGLGATLALNWKLPADLIQAIRWHHRPADAFSPTDPPALRKAVHIVQIANQLTKYCYPYADCMEIEVVSDEAFALLGLSPSLEKLLDAPAQAAITRAIFFADSNSRRPITAPRRFLRPVQGDDAARAAAAAVPAERRVVLDDQAIAALFEIEAKSLQINADGPAIKIPDGTAPARFATPASAPALQKCIGALRAHQDEMSLSSETRSTATLTVRSLLPNLLPLSTASETIEIFQSAEGRKFVLAIRAPGLSASRRLGTPSNPETALRLAEADFANVLNLGWFERIAISSDGATVAFWSR